MQVVSRPGGTLPLHATAVGKVLRAWAPDDVQRAVLSQPERLTPYTVVEPARLATQLEEIRRTGVAWTREEMTIGASSLAVPVNGMDGAVVAAVGLVVPSPRTNLRSGLPALKSTAAALTAHVRARDAVGAA